MKLTTALLRNRAFLAVLFVVDGVVHLVGAPVVLGEYWLLQELYSGFASTRIWVLMFGVPSMLIFGILFLVTTWLVWRHRGRLFGAFIAFLSVPNDLVVIWSMRPSWISVAFCVAGVLLSLFILVNLALRYLGVKSQFVERKSRKKQRNQSSTTRKSIRPIAYARDDNGY